MIKIESFRASKLNEVVEAANSWLKKNDGKSEIITSTTCFDSRMYGEYIITLLYKDKGGK